MPVPIPEEYQSQPPPYQPIQTDNREVDNTVWHADQVIDKSRQAALARYAELGGSQLTDAELQAAAASDAAYETSAGLRGSGAYMSPDHQAAFQAQYDQITGGMADTLANLTTAHQAEMLRIQAANDAYLQNVMAAAPIHAQNIQKSINMAQDALEQMASVELQQMRGSGGGGGRSASGGSGGRGGGGGGGGRRSGSNTNSDVSSGDDQSVRTAADREEQLLNQLDLTNRIFGTPERNNMDDLTILAPQMTSSGLYGEMETMMTERHKAGDSFDQVMGAVNAALQYKVDMGELTEAEAAEFMIALNNEWAPAFEDGRYLSHTGEYAPVGSNQGQEILKTIVDMTRGYRSDEADYNARQEELGGMSEWQWSHTDEDGRIWHNGDDITGMDEEFQRRLLGEDYGGRGHFETTITSNEDGPDQAATRWVPGWDDEPAETASQREKRISSHLSSSLERFMSMLDSQDPQEELAQALDAAVEGNVQGHPDTQYSNSNSPPPAPSFSGPQPGNVPSAGGGDPRGESAYQPSANMTTPPVSDMQQALADAIEALGQASNTPWFVPNV